MSKEKLWIEFCVRSDKRKELISIRLDDEELESDKLAIRNFLRSIVTCIEYNRLFINKVPIYLKDIIAHLSQEIKIESNPHFMERTLSKEADKLANMFAEELGLQPRESVSKKTANYYSKDDRIFHENLRNKASLSMLDGSIISNIDNMENLVYLFKGQTILKNHVFFDLFQHWFDSPHDAHYIDDLVYQLKKKADLIKTGPKDLVSKDKIKLITRYYFLIFLFSAMKKAAKKSSSKEANRGWTKLRIIRNRYLDIEKIIKSNRIRYQSICLADFLKKEWLQSQFKQIIKLAKYNMTKEEFENEIKRHIKYEKEIGRKPREIGKSKRRYLRELSLSVIRDVEPSELALFYLSIIEGFSIRKIKRVIENNKSMAESIKDRLFSILS